MNIRILSFNVFSPQFNLNNVDGDAINTITPRAITSMDKIINTFIFFYLLNKRLKLNLRIIIINNLF